MLENAGIFVNFRPLKTRTTNIKTRDTRSQERQPILHAEDTMGAQSQPMLHADIHYESTTQAHTSTLETKQVGSTLFKENQNAPRPSEHPPVRGGNVKTFRWDQRLQIQNLFMAFKRVPRWK